MTKYESKRLAFDLAWQIWSDHHPNATEEEKQKKRTQLWRKWRIQDDYEATEQWPQL